MRIRVRRCQVQVLQGTAHSVLDAGKLSGAQRRDGLCDCVELRYLCEVPQEGLPRPCSSMGANYVVARSQLST